MWARGEVVFAHLTPLGGRHPDGQPRLRCRAGIRIDRVAGQERRLLRDYVIETRRARRVASAATDVVPLALRAAQVAGTKRRDIGTAVAPWRAEEESTWIDRIARVACGT